MKKRGQSLIELLVAVGVAAVFLPALATGLVASRNGRAQEGQRLLAVGLLKEAKEAVRTVRENDWTTFGALSGAGNLYPVVSGSTWTLSNNAVNENVNGFKRKVVISDVCRDTTGAVSATCPTMDPSTKKVVATVSWTTPLASSVSETFYLTRMDNLSFKETRKAEFDLGSVTNVKTQPSSPPDPLVSDDGEIVLSQTGGIGDWCQPGTPSATVDLPKNGVGKAISAIQGQAAAGTGENASGVSYANLTITDPAYPTAPSADISGTFDGYKTNAVFTEANYAYLGTDTNNKEVAIVDLTSKDANNKYSLAGYFDAPGQGNGNSVFVTNDIGYMTSGNKFYTFDLRTGRSGSRPRLNTATVPTLSGTGRKIMVVGDNVYVATTGTSSQLQIINVSDPVNPAITSSFTVNGGEGRDVFVNQNQTRAYLVTAQAAGKAEFFLIQLNPMQVLGTYDTQEHGDMDPQGVVAVSGARAIVVGTGGQEYQVLKLDSESSPAYCGGINVGASVNGVGTVFTAASRAYSYIVSDIDPEFRIIEGGSGAGNGSYVPTGTFISAPFGPLTLPTAFNNFVANVYQPESNDIQIYVAVADAVGGSCTSGVNYTFVGVNGTATPFQTASTLATTIKGTIPFGNYAPSYQNPGKCFKYKAVLSTGDSTVTPVFKDITVNYSP